MNCVNGLNLVVKAKNKNVSQNASCIEFDLKGNKIGDISGKIKVVYKIDNEYMGKFKYGFLPIIGEIENYTNYFVLGVKRNNYEFVFDIFDLNNDSVYQATMVDDLLYCEKVFEHDNNIQKCVRFVCSSAVNKTDYITKHNFDTYNKVLLKNNSNMHLNDVEAMLVSLSDHKNRMLHYAMQLKYLVNRSSKIYLEFLTNYFSKNKWIDIAKIVDNKFFVSKFNKLKWNEYELYNFLGHQSNEFVLNLYSKIKKYRDENKVFKELDENIVDYLI